MHVSKTNHIKKTNSSESLSKQPLNKQFTYDARRKSIQRCHSSDVLITYTKNPLGKLKSTSCDNLDELNTDHESKGSNKKEEIDSLIIEKLKLDSEHLSEYGPQKLFDENQMNHIVNFVKINSPGVIYDVYKNHETMIQSPDEMAHILKDHITESVISGIITHLLHNV